MKKRKKRMQNCGEGSQLNCKAKLSCLHAECPGFKSLQAGVGETVIQNPGKSRPVGVANMEADGLTLHKATFYVDADSEANGMLISSGILATQWKTGKAFLPSNSAKIKLSASNVCSLKPAIKCLSSLIIFAKTKRFPRAHVCFVTSLTVYAN